METVFKKLKLNDKNPRKISKDQFERLKTSIKSFPQMLEKRPVVYNDSYVVLGGNMRLKALQELVLEGFQLKPEYFESATGWTPEQEREFVIRDNIELGEWNKGILSEEWGDLPLEAWGIDAKGWRTEDVMEDEPPALTEEVFSKLGEVYQLGRHRLMCGDSAHPDIVHTLMGDQKADMVFTDPPYGVDYEGGTGLKIQNDKTTEVFAKVLPNFIGVTKAGASFYVCCPAGNNFKDFMIPFQEYCYQSSTIIWVKNSLVLGHGDYHYQHEPILYGWAKGATHTFYGDRKQTTVWNIDRPTVSKEHPTMKPLALVAKAINNSSKQDDIVLDLFGGSGSTLVASEQLQRICFTMELDPHYVDVIRKRYAKIIGKEEEWQEVTPKL